MAKNTKSSWWELIIMDGNYNGKYRYEEGST